MREPSLKTSRLAIAGGFAGAIALAVAGFVLGRSTSPTPEPASPMPIQSEAAPLSQTPRILNRSDIIALGDRAADAFASGKVFAERNDLAGRRFDLVLPFGCEGPAAEGSIAALRWNYDAAEQTLRLHAAPSRWTSQEWGLVETGTTPRLLQGFWVTRPWSSSERCPSAPLQEAASGAADTALTGQTLAVAAVRTADQRRDKNGDPRAHEIVTRLPPESLGVSPGFNLRLTGRIERFEDGVVRCVQPAGIEQRPACVVAVSFDEVRIESPSSGEILGTWSMRPAEGAAQ